MSATFQAVVQMTTRRDGETKVVFLVPKSETAEVLKLVQWEDVVLQVTVSPLSK